MEIGSIITEPYVGLIWKPESIHVPLWRTAKSLKRSGIIVLDEHRLTSGYMGNIQAYCCKMCKKK